MANNLWAARAFVQSYLDSYSVLYGCQVLSAGELNLLRYGINVRAKLEDCEIYSPSKNPQDVLKTINQLNLLPGERYVLNIFHMEEEAREIEKVFESAGYRFAFTNVVRGLTLPTTSPDRGIPIKQVVDPDQIAFVNLTHQFFQPMPETVLNHSGVRAFYAELDGQAAGWGLLVTTAPNAAYISDMFTLPSFRGRGVAEAMLNRMHEAAASAGKTYSLLVPSVMAWNYYQRFGYETLVCFSVFHQVNH
jgi:GNAT superfamily N-acetyltransferase